MNNKNEQLNGQFRHLLTTIGGILIMKGLVTEQEAELYMQLLWALPGVAVCAFGFVKSWNSKKTDAKVADLVEQVTVKVIDRIEGKL